MQDFRKLRVWQAAKELAVFTYQVTRGFPREELFGLASQMRTAAISVSANVAEGSARGTKRDSKRFLQISYASATELLSHFIVATELGITSRQQMEEAECQVEIVRRMLSGLMARLK